MNTQSKVHESKIVTLTIRETVRRYESWKSDERTLTSESERVYRAKFKRKTLAKYGIAIALSEVKATKEVL